MRLLIRVFCLLAFVAALAALVTFSGELTATGLTIGLVAVSLLAVLAGYVFGAGGTEPDSTRLDAAVTASSEPDQPRETPDLAGRATLAFARQLLAAGTWDALRNTVIRELPLMLGGRQVWLTWDQSVAREPDLNTPWHATVTNQPVQEWTTFVLRLDDKRVGLLGIESPGGLTPPLNERIQHLAPLIAQAGRTVHEADVFREASVIDLLTGAATRREGLNRLQAEVKRGQRTGTTMAVLMIDLDHFKTINDQFGHAIGDALLTAIGQTMQRTLRASDIRCRWGGEEFLIVLPDTSLAQAQVVATYLLQNIAATAVPSPKGLVSSTASIGVTITRPAETDVNRIIDRADMALYQAKNAGRSCVRVVLGGLEGEPVGTEGRGGPPPTPSASTLPFPDRRDPSRRDRRRVPGPGRRKTDLTQDFPSENDPANPALSSHRSAMPAGGQ